MVHDNIKVVESKSGRTKDILVKTQRSQKYGEKAVEYFSIVLDNDWVNLEDSGVTRLLIAIKEFQKSIGLKEDVKLFEKVKEAIGTELSEDNVKQLAELVENALLEQKIELASEHAKLQAEEIEKAVAANQEKLDECVDIAVEKILDEHQEKFVKTEAFDKMKTVFEAIKEAFEANGFELNVDSRVDEKFKEAEKDYAAIFERYTNLKSKLEEVQSELELAQRAIIFESMTKDLAESTKEKIGQIVETVKFDDNQEFRTGLKLIVEGQTKMKKEDDDKEDDEGDDDKEDDKKPMAMKEKKYKKEGEFVKPAKPLHEMTSEERMAFYRTF